MPCLSLQRRPERTAQSNVTYAATTPVTGLSSTAGPVLVYLDVALALLLPQFLVYGAHYTAQTLSCLTQLILLTIKQRSSIDFHDSGQYSSPRLSGFEIQATMLLF